MTILTTGHVNIDNYECKIYAFDREIRNSAQIDNKIRVIEFYVEPRVEKSSQRPEDVTLWVDETIGIPHGTEQLSLREIASFKKSSLAQGIVLIQKRKRVYGSCLSGYE